MTEFPDYIKAVGHEAFSFEVFLQLASEEAKIRWTDTAEITERIGGEENSTPPGLSVGNVIG